MKIENCNRYHSVSYDLNNFQSYTSVLSQL